MFIMNLYLQNFQTLIKKHYVIFFLFKIMRDDALFTYFKNNFDLRKTKKIFRHVFIKYEFEYFFIFFARR